jgi:hypothetical protein
MRRTSLRTADALAGLLVPGEHTIWVVAGDGIHTPPAAGVMDKVTVAVG